MAFNGGLLFMLLALCPGLLAQVDRATLSGTVMDTSGAVVPGARVVATATETGFRREAVTGANGNYVLSSLPIGLYTVTVTQQAFQTVSVKELRLGVGDSRNLDLRMEVGTLETSVTIEDVTTPIESSSAVVGTVVGSQQVKGIPLNGRHWASLMALAPGAINTGDGSQQTIRFVGRSRDDNNWTFDGLDATGVKDPRQESALRLVISTDSIAEFRVNTSLYSAESGSGAGGQVNLVSKSGSNAFHGGLFEFFRNDHMDARNPFDTVRQPFRLNQFGGNVGGPIIRNRTFFFGNYEGLQQRIASTLTGDVPSAAFRARPTVPVISGLMNIYPVGTVATSSPDINRAMATSRQTWQENSGTLRIDHRFNDKNTIFGRFNIDDGVTSTPRSVIEDDVTNDEFRPSNFVLQYQRVFSPTVVNEVKAGYNRSTLTRDQSGPVAESAAVAGFMTLNAPGGLVENGTSYSLIDNLSITKGRHTIKLGGEIRRAHVNVADPNLPTTSATFATRQLFLENRVDSAAGNGGSPVLGTRKWYYYAFVQDDFRVRKNLILNLGLRYEYYGINREVNDVYKVFDMFACQGFCPHGTPWYFPDRNNFDPRFGLAWSLGKTVIRTGAGIYHGPGQIDDVNTPLDNVAERFSLTTQEAPNLSYPVAPFLPLARTVGATPRSLQRDRRDLYNFQWGFSVQRELPAGFLGQVGYVGSSGVKLFARQYINNLDPVTKKRYLPSFGRMDEKRQDGKSNFNALQISLHRRTSSGLNLGTEYMWSHAINDGNIGGGEGAQPQIALCRACDRGNSGQDVRHTINVNWIYELPFGRGKPHLNTGAASKIFGGWETSGIYTARTGRMMTIGIARSTGAVPDGNTSGQRPNIVPGVSIYPEGGSTYSMWLNPAAFAIPANGTWGNAGRAVAVGPGLAQLDLTLQKRIPVAEGKVFLFRVEAFNVSNRTQAGNPGTTLTSPASFGVVTAGLNRTIGTGTSRQLQLALRFNF